MNTELVAVEVFEVGMTLEEGLLATERKGRELEKAGAAIYVKGMLTRAEAYQGYLDLGHSQRETAKYFGVKSPSTIANYLDVSNTVGQYLNEVEALIEADEVSLRKVIAIGKPKIVLHPKLQKWVDDAVVTKKWAEEQWKFYTDPTRNYGNSLEENSRVMNKIAQNLGDINGAVAQKETVSGRGHYKKMVKIVEVLASALGVAEDSEEWELLKAGIVTGDVRAAKKAVKFYREDPQSPDSEPPFTDPLKYIEKLEWMMDVETKRIVKSVSDNNPIRKMNEGYVNTGVLRGYDVDENVIDATIDGGVLKVKDGEEITVGEITFTVEVQEEAGSVLVKDIKTPLPEGLSPKFEKEKAETLNIEVKRSARHRDWTEQGYHLWSPCKWEFHTGFASDAKTDVKPDTRDCVARALSLAGVSSYDALATKFYDFYKNKGVKWKEDSRGDALWQEHIIDAGWLYVKTPSGRLSKEYLETLPQGGIILSIAGHLIFSKEGILYDTYNASICRLGRTLTKKGVINARPLKGYWFLPKEKIIKST